MRWGLVPSWAPDPSIGNRMINARCETLTEKPSFKQLLGTHRCLALPMDSTNGEEREKEKHRCVL